MAEDRMYRLQTRKPGRRYVTFRSARRAIDLGWDFKQMLVPYGDASVRVIDSAGKVIVRATPRKEEDDNG
jgi:formylmethanofuran dehydrogenase subunit D